jgi:hypothetical protein
MESVIKWQTGVPKVKRITYLVSLNTGKVTTTTWIDNEFKWYHYKQEEIIAWCPLMDIEPYKE